MSGLRIVRISKGNTYNKSIKQVGEAGEPTLGCLAWKLTVDLPGESHHLDPAVTKAVG